MGEMKPPAPVMLPPSEKRVSSLEEFEAERKKKFAMMPPPPPVFSATERKPTSSMPPPLPLAPSSQNAMMPPPPPAALAADNKPEGSWENAMMPPPADEKLEQSPEPQAPEKKASQRPYEIPEWSQPPGQPYSLEVLKGGAILERLDVSERGAYMFGRHESCDFMLDHPSVSRFHAVLQFNGKGNAFVFDLASTHGTFVNKLKVKAKVHVPIQVGNMFKFGQSSRFYVFQGPEELMPQEGLCRKERQLMRQLEARQMKQDEEASLLRARMEAQNSEGASWGMGEDAVDEEAEEDDLTWQHYTGQLNEKQQKTLEQIQKRNEKLTNLKKEIDAIQAKENAQGGLTQGQQTQVSRNEKRIQELLEQLESLEENLNDSIKESVLGKPLNKRKKKNADEDDDRLSDDDEFYDRTRKKQKKNEQQAESAVSLLEKIDRLAEEMDEVRVKLAAEENKQNHTSDEVNETAAAEDPLDAFMTNVSHEIVEDTAARLQKEMQRLQAEKNRLEILLKVADPTGEVAHRWRNKIDEPETEPEVKPEVEPEVKPEEPAAMKPHEEKQKQQGAGGDEPSTSGNPTSRGGEAEGGAIWIGAPHREKTSEEEPSGEGKAPEDGDDGVGFVSYKDRRARLQSARAGDKSREVEASEAAVAGDIALLLRYKKGLTSTPDDDDDDDDEGGEEDSRVGQRVPSPGSKQQQRKRKKMKKRMLGPERPNYMESEEGSEEQASWVPPAGQTGDGRTALNEKYGY